MLILWFDVFFLAHEQFFLLQSRWFKLSIELFDGLNYLGITIYKIGIIIFLLVPLIALAMAIPGA